ncbi:hypothetical protein N431DRAFT_439033 [Stipitochalara longipes BDJ]|nr:hypothetical protein N431DRAFT_439033 [Stipitochalara longipes BDJ]
MAQSTPQTPSSQPPPRTTFDASSRANLVHNISLGALIVCPIIILLPPRKLDIYTLGLLSGMFAGGNQLSKEYTGTSILQRFGNRLESVSGRELPPKAREMQARLKEEKARRADGIESVRRKGEELAERSRVEKEKKEKEDRGLLEKVWMGSEGEDWKAKRDQREKEALEEGKGYGGLIVDQIWEVWNWGREKTEEIKEKDEKVVAERKEGKSNKK